MAGNDIRGTLTLDKAVLICSRNEMLSVFPRLAIEVVRLCQSPTVVHRDLESAILQDPGLTARILQIANSPLYGARGATSISRAANVMGLNGVRSAVTRLVVQQVSVKHASAANFDHTALWTHSMAVAAVARILGTQQSLAYAEELFVIGMLHEFGLLALDRLAPDRLGQAILSSKEAGQPLAFGVQVVFGFDHHELAAQTLQNWNFTPLCCDAIRYIDSPTNSADHQVGTQIMANASAIACLAGMPNHSCDIGACKKVLADQKFEQSDIESVIELLCLDVGNTMAHFGVAA